LLQDAPAENGTGSPDVLSAETVNVVLYVAVAGACVLTRIVCGVVPAAALAVIASAPTTQTSRRTSPMSASLPRSGWQKNSSLTADFRRRSPLIGQSPSH